MFKAIFSVQLKSSRLALAVLALAAFALPLLTVQGFNQVDPNQWDVAAMLDLIRRTSAVYPMLATAIGLVLGVMAWTADHRGEHVYALTLPLPRWHYVLLKFAAGVLLVAVPVTALWLGALIASAAAIVPPGLQAYPTAVAIRFLLAALVAYGCFFAISSATTRTAGYVLASLVGVLVVQIIFAIGNVDIDLIEPMWMALVNLPGPFEVFTGRWMLIDV